MTQDMLRTWQKPLRKPKVLGECGAGTIPLITGLDFGHTDPMTVLPYGVEAEIDCGDASLALVEAVVSAGAKTGEVLI